MANYEDVFELLEAVRTYELKGDERIRPCNSVKGTEVGYCTADSEGPSTRWTITVADLRKSCEGRTSDEAKMLLTKMRAFQDRRVLMEDLRSGKLSLEEKPAPPEPATPPPELIKALDKTEEIKAITEAAKALPEEPDEGDLEGFLGMFES